MRSNIVKKNCGITLIALVITIIVMLILVAVTISMAVNGGLFEYAGNAGKETNNAIRDEQQLASGKVNIDNTVYNSIDEYLQTTGGSGGTGGSGDTLPAYENANKENDLLTENATYKSGEYTAVIPKGFKIIEGINGTTTIADGLVIQDAEGNEFVWIPVTDDIETGYDSDNNGADNGYYEPKELTSTWSISTLATKPKYDSQEILDELYGKDYYTYSEDFKYAEEYAEMVEKVNQFNGFYIGRYETTIDSNGNIGTKYNTPVLTSGTTLFTKDETNYPYRWYGLYQAGKNANVTGNGSNVQTAMIYGVLYDQAMQFIRDQKTAGKTTYDVDTATATWHGSANGHTGVVNSAQANPGETGDVALNIWDLESNAYEWTQEADSSSVRVIRGGKYNNSYKASDRIGSFPTTPTTDFSARVALYIK